MNYPRTDVDVLTEALLGALYASIKSRSDANMIYQMVDDYSPKVEERTKTITIVIKEKMKWHEQNQNKDQ